MAIDKSTSSPSWSICIIGRMKKLPIAPGHNKHTQNNKWCGISKWEQHPLVTEASSTSASPMFTTRISMVVSNRSLTSFSRDVQSFMLLPLVLSFSNIKSVSLLMKWFSHGVPLREKVHRTHHWVTRRQSNAQIKWCWELTITMVSLKKSLKIFKESLCLHTSCYSQMDQEIWKTRLASGHESCSAHA